MSDGLGFDLNAALAYNANLQRQPSLAYGVAQAGASTGDLTQTADLAQQVARLTEAQSAGAGIEKASKQHEGIWGHVASWAGDAASAIGSIPGVGTAAHYVSVGLNAGIQNAQHEYRFLRDVYVRHGALASLGALTALTVGGAGGALLGSLVGPEGTAGGAVIGGEGAIFALAHLDPDLKDSWKRTEDGEKYQLNGKSVSFGRDIASHLPFIQDHKTWFKYTSGAFDGLFDITADPLLAAGKINAARNLAGKGAEEAMHLDAAGNSLGGISDMRLRLASRIGLTGPEDFDRAYALNGNFKRGVNAVIDTQDVRGIKQLMPGIDEDSAKALAAATTTGEVRDVYSRLHLGNALVSEAPTKSWLGAEMASGLSRIRQIGVNLDHSQELAQAIAGKVPVSFPDNVVQTLADKYQVPVDMVKGLSTNSQTELSKSFYEAQTAEAMGDSTQAIPSGVYKGLLDHIRANPSYTTVGNTEQGKVASIFEKMYRRATTTLPIERDWATGHQSTTDFDIMGDSAGDVINSIAKFAYNDAVGRDVQDLFTKADQSERMLIYKNLLGATAWKMGLDRHPEAWAWFNQTLADNVDRGVEYGIGGDAMNPLSKVILPTADGGVRTARAAIWSSQTGKAVIPQLTDMKYAIAQLDKFKGLPYRMDDFLYNTVTQRFFKRMALLSGGFAMRVGGGEAMFAALKDGVIQTVRNRIAHSLAAHAAEKLSGRELSEAMDSRLDGVMTGLGDKAFEIEKGVEGGLSEQGKSEIATRADLIARTQELTGGHMVPAVLDANHYGHDILEAPSDNNALLMLKGARRAEQTNMRLGNFNVFRNANGVEDRNFRAMLAQHINTISDDPGARQLASNYLGAIKSLRAPEDGMTRVFRPLDSEDWYTNVRQAREAAANGQVPLRFLDYNPVDAGAAVRQNDDGTLAIQIAALKKRLEGPVVRDETEAQQYAIDEQIKLLSSDGGKKLLARMTRGSQGALDNNGGLRGLSDVRLRSLLGATTGQDGTLNEKALESVAKGEKLNGLSFDHLDSDALPTWTPGQEAEPYLETGFDRLTNAGFSKVISPIINHLSRNSLFQQRLYDEYMKMAPMQEAGLVTEGDRFTTAFQRATMDAVKDVHNPQLRVQLSTNLRNTVPFFFAQEQAYRRWGRLIAGNPEALRKLQMLHQAGVNSGWVTKDPSTGQEQFQYPVSGFIGTHVMDIANRLGMKSFTGLPLAWHGNVQSLSSVTPFAQIPGVQFSGPIVGIPLAALEHYAPESAPLTQGVEGTKGQGQQVWQMLLPNTALQDVLRAYNGDHSRAFQSAQMQALQAEMYASLNDPHHPFNLADPLEYQHMLTKSKEYARTLFLMKAVIGEMEPTQASFDIGNIKLNDEFRNAMLTSKTLGEAFDKFQKAHPDKNITPFTVFQSDSPYGAAHIPATQQALDFFEQNKGFLSAVPYAGSWLVPQLGTENADASKIYNEQLALGMREKRSPEEFQKALYVAAGNAQYYALKKPYDTALKQAQDSGNTPLAKQLETAWSSYVQMHSQQNPVWAEDHLGASRQNIRQRTLSEFEAVFAPENAQYLPDNPQVQLVGDLYQGYKMYDAYRRQIAADPSGSPVTTKELDTTWQKFLNNLADSTPALAPVIQKIFLEVN